MTQPSDRLYKLLPVFYRQRDAEQGYPLQMLLRVIQEQVDVIENDITQLYDNWFIETCEDWVVPYIGDLIGYTPVHEGGDAGDAASAALTKILAPRREVANTIRYRRRKGTLALLQELAASVAGWPALAVEFDRYLEVSQSVDHLRQRRGHTADLRLGEILDVIGTAFDTLGHTIDVRSPSAPVSKGTYNIPSLSLFVWRLKPYPVTHTKAYCLEEAGDHCYTFSVLGNDVQLYNHPASEQPSVVPDELSFPVPIRRRALDERIVENEVERYRASAKYYGDKQSLAIWAEGWADLDPTQPIPRERIVPTHLHEWKYRPKPGYVAVDPELGRIAFPPGQLPGDVWVSYYYAFSADIGGGEYQRPIVLPAASATTYCVGPSAEFPTIRAAYQKWLEQKPANAVIELSDSGIYEEEENLNIELGKGQNLELRAARGARAVILLVDWRASHPDVLIISGEAGSTFTLDGVLVAGRKVEIKGDLDKVTIRHSTLVPGWTLHPDCRPRRMGDPSLMMVNTKARLRVEHSITGGIHVIQDNLDADPVQLHISDSIVDATSPEHYALCAPEGSIAPATLTMRRCTVFGLSQTHAIKLAENSIFTGQVTVARRQEGCIRFCYVPAGSRTPRRYHCQPDLVDKAMTAQLQAEQVSKAESDALRNAERLRVQPEFSSVRFGTAAYARLTDASADEIKRGAEDQSEMGVFHDLFQPQRETNLRMRLAEYTPAESDAGIIYAS